MSRISSITNPGNHELKDLFSSAEAWMGFLPNDGLLMAHKPEMLQAFFGLAKAVYADGKIDAGLKRLIGNISSMVAGCIYCSAHTSYGGSRQGVSEEKLKAVWEFETSPLFSEKERAALNIALKASMVPNQVSDSDFDRLKIHYAEEAIIEIVGVISLFGFLNRWNTTLDTALESAPKHFYESIKRDHDG